MRQTHLASGGRYPILRTVAILYFVGAVVSLVGGFVAAVWFLVNGDPYNWAGGRFRLVMGTLTGTFFSVIAMLAIAELIKLFIDVEHNTRMSAMASAASASGAVSSSSAGSPVDGKSRAAWMEGEETAEGALLRGH